MASYYVSTTGNDNNPGTEIQPFKTIQKAREVIRTRTGTWTGDIYVWLRGGTYTPTASLEFTAADAGKNGHYVAYQAYRGERPIISGGTPLTGWTPYQNGIYRTSCDSMEFRQLYVNGKKATRARFPNKGTYNRLASWNTSSKTINIIADELGSVQNLPNGKVEMIVQQYWAESIMRVTSVANNGPYKSITVNNHEKEIVFNREWPQKSADQPYHFENSLDFLDQEGEWYLDNNVFPHYVYYKPFAEENLSTASVVAPNIETLVRVSGADFGNHAHHLIFEGITFEYSNWTRPTYYGNIGLQSQQYSVGNDRADRPKAAFYVRNADHMRFTRNVFRNCGSTGLDIYTSTNNIVVEGNVFHDISGNGMQIGKFSEPDVAIATVYNPSDTREYCETNVIANNYVYTCGTDYYCANGIAAGYIRNTSIIHNDVTDLPYTGINSGWGWTFSTNAMSSNHIDNNHIYDVIQLLCDGAGIYTLSNQSPASTIQNNYIHNTSRSIWATTQYTPTYPVASIYLDQGTSGFTIDHNCLVNTIPKWEVNFTDIIGSYNTLGTNPSYDAAIINNAGIQSAFQDIRSIDPMPAKPFPPTPSIPTSGLKLWLKADAPEGAIVKDINNLVNTWGDQSGYTNTAMQTIASYQPLYVSNTINNKPTLRFDGIDDRMDILSLAGSKPQYTFIMVIKPKGLTDNNQCIGASGGWGQFMFHSAANGTVYCGTGVPGRLTTSRGTMTDSVVQLFTFGYLGTTGTSKLYKNGAEVASGVLSQVQTAWTGFLLGLTNSSTLKGDVPEIILYDRVLSATERTTIESYLTIKYGIITNLAKMAAPTDTVIKAPNVYTVTPNPANSEITIAVDASLSKGNGTTIKKVHLFNINGRLVKTVSHQTSHLQMSVSNLPAGIYFIEVHSSANKIYRQKIVIQH